MNSDYDVRLATLEKLGGDASKNYASVYDIDLAILEATEGGGSGIPDAPSDNKLYGRKDAEWAEVVIPSPGISDAPSDGKKYARKDGTWEEVNEPDLTNYATKTWVGEQGYLTSVPSEYVTDTELTNGLSGKQDTISDLATIRSGAALGSTALQSVPAGYATETWVGNQGYITNSALSGYATETWVGQQGYLTAVPSNYVKFVSLTQEQYDALTVKDPATLYIISDAQ